MANKIQGMVRSNRVWLVLVVVVCFLGCSTKEDDIPPIAEKVDEMLTQAQQSFEMGDAGGGAVLMLDALLLLKPSPDWPDGFTSALDQAKTQFQEKKLGEAVLHVRDALALFQPKKMERKKEVAGRISAVADVLKKNIEAVRAQLEKGHADKAVVFVLEGLLLLAPITNPE